MLVVYFYFFNNEGSWIKFHIGYNYLALIFLNNYKGQNKPYPAFNHLLYSTE